MRIHRSSKDLLHPFIKPYDFTHLRLSLSSRHQSDVVEVLSAFVGKRLISGDGIPVGQVVDVLILGWDQRPKYLKCELSRQVSYKGKRYIYYPIKDLLGLSKEMIVTRHTLAETFAGNRYSPEDVRGQEAFPLVSLRAFAKRFAIIDSQKAEMSFMH